MEIQKTEKTKIDQSECELWYCNDFSATTMEGGILQMLLLIHEIKIKSDDLGSCLQTVFTIFTVTLLWKRMKAGTWYMTCCRGVSVWERDSGWRKTEVTFEISSIINFYSTLVTPEAGKWVARKILELIAVIRKYVGAESRETRLWMTAEWWGNRVSNLQGRIFYNC